MKSELWKRRSEWRILWGRGLSELYFPCIRNIFWSARMQANLNSGKLF